MTRRKYLSNSKNAIIFLILVHCYNKGYRLYEKRGVVSTSNFL